MSKRAALAALAAIVSFATPARADLILGDGWDLVDAYLYGGAFGGAIGFMIEQPAYLEFTTLIGDDSTFDLYVLNTSCTSPLASVCWTDIGTTSQGIHYPGVNPPDQEDLEADFDAAWASPYASHGQWLIAPGSWEASVSLDLFDPGVNGGINATFRLVAAPESSTWAMMLLGFSGLAYAAMRRRAACR